ncbi:MAG: hypothetical protein KAG64_01025 [Bacteroidales bacterium]|nr:hypothetical protein [Bacteroidales bacterium]
MKIKPEVKFFIIRFFLAGLVYASFMASFNYYEGDPFSIWRFVFNAIFFGGFMGVAGLYERRKKLKK